MGSRAPSSRARATAAPTNRVPYPTRVIRSPKRRHTISARIRDNVIEVLLPAGMSATEEAKWVARMQERLQRKRTGHSDAELLERARQLSLRYYDGVLLPSAVRWSETQNTRWGSCTVESGTIRLSARMQDFPSWVVDYVLVHELCHLRYAGHGPRFWALVNRFPLTERARGFLIAKGGDMDGVD